MHPLYTAEVVLKPEVVLILESLPIVDELHKSLQHQDLLGRPLLQNQQ